MSPLVLTFAGLHTKSSVRLPNENRYKSNYKYSIRMYVDDLSKNKNVDRERSTRGITQLQSCRIYLYIFYRFNGVPL